MTRRLEMARHLLGWLIRDAALRGDDQAREALLVVKATVDADLVERIEAEGRRAA